MSRLFFVGDTHGSIEINKLSFKHFPLGRELTKEDIVCICGDVGLVWDNSRTDNYWQNWCEDLPFTVVGCLGNHENYNLIRQMPTEIWNGGLVRKIRPHVMFLENGEIFNLNGHSIFVMGGATSLDKTYRKEGKSWWPQEIPSYQEFEYASNNLKKHDFKVDTIVSHCAPNSIIDATYKFLPFHDSVTNYLEKFVNENVAFQNWFIGHYHTDRTIYNKFHILYDDFIELLPDNTTKYICTADKKKNE